MSKNTPNPERQKRKSWKHQAHDIASANGKLTGLLATAKGDMAQIAHLLRPHVENMRLIITPGQRKLKADLDAVVDLTEQWEALRLVKRDCVTDEQKGEVKGVIRKQKEKQVISGKVPDLKTL